MNGGEFKKSTSSSANNYSSSSSMTKSREEDYSNRGQFHQHLRTKNLRAQDSMPFLANSVRQMGHKLGKFQLTTQANLAAPNIGETERRLFRQTLCAGSFLLGEKF